MVDGRSGLCAVSAFPDSSVFQWLWSGCPRHSGRDSSGGVATRRFASHSSLGGSPTVVLFSQQPTVVGSETMPRGRTLAPQQQHHSGPGPSTQEPRRSPTIHGRELCPRSEISARRTSQEQPQDQRYSQTTTTTIRVNDDRDNNRDNNNRDNDGGRKPCQ